MLLFEMAKKMAKMGKKNSHEGVYHLKMASSSLFVITVGDLVPSQV